MLVVYLCCTLEGFIGFVLGVLLWSACAFLFRVFFWRLYEYVLVGKCFDRGRRLPYRVMSERPFCVVIWYWKVFS